MSKLIGTFIVFSLGLLSCVDFAQEQRGNSSAANNNRSPVAQQTSAPVSAKNSNSSADNRNDYRDPIAAAAAGNEASSDELEAITTPELRELTRCIIEEDVTIAPEGEGKAPLRFTFDSSGAVAPCGKIVESIWSFGDGTKAIGTTVTHTYSGPGEYIVKLSLTDNKGHRNLLDTEYALTVRGEKSSIEIRRKQTTKPGRTMERGKSVESRKKY